MKNIYPQYPLFPESDNDEYLNLMQLCRELSISYATGSNWLRLGKITKSEQGFSRRYVEQLKKDLNEQDLALKSRRNKRLSSGRKLYVAYLPKYSANIEPVVSISNFLTDEDLEVTDELLRTILTGAAVSLICQQAAPEITSAVAEAERLDKSVLELVLGRRIKLGRFTRLLDPLLPKDINRAMIDLENYPELFYQDFHQENQADTLGFLYISCQNLGRRKAHGIYYTPTDVVVRAVNSLIADGNYHDKAFIDPCCGTGNFLMQLPDDIPFNNIYGNDLDETAIVLARISMALKYPEVSAEMLESHLQISNYLTSIFKLGEFDCILGNPPWGSVFSEEEEKFIRENFICAGKCRHPESFELFIEEAIKELKPEGTLSFVVPEALLNVKSHKNVRELIMQETNISEIEYIGDVFDGVQCPAIILKLSKSSKGINTRGMIIRTPKREFVIGRKRPVTSDGFSFNLDDSEYEIIRQISRCGRYTLKDHASFALGIVTGNNRELLSPAPRSSASEPIICGTDISRYGYETGRNYVEFSPERFQQCCAPEFFRTKEKLIYRFISKRLTFAYDNRQVLTLNSANILIPDISELDIMCVLALLNSRILQFYFWHSFNSCKVLRSHLEALPLPEISDDEQAVIRALVLRLTNMDNLQPESTPYLEKQVLSTDTDSKDREALYDELDLHIANLYGLSRKQYALIREATEKDCTL